MLLIDTSDYSQARLLGFDAPCHPVHDGEGLTVAYEPAEPTRFISTGMTAPSIKLTGPDGEIEIVGEAAIRALARAVTHAADLMNAAALAKAA